MDKFRQPTANYSILTRAYTHLLPGRCSLCSGDLESVQHCICDSCVKELPWLEAGCQQCAAPLPTDALCPSCQSDPPTYRRCISAFTYQPPVDQVILRLKNDPYATEIKQLSALLAERIFHSYPRGSLPRLLVPMPLHWQKMARRGFNQSLVIGKLLSRYMLHQHSTALKLSSDICDRVTNNQAQQTLDKKQRARSVKNAFAVSAEAAREVKGLSVAVIDDVVTTGATANAIATALRNAGAEQVDIWCLARTGLE